MRINSSIALNWVANGLGLAVSILIIPYLLTTLGSATYGKIALVQIASFTSFAIIDFGMGIAGPKWLSQVNITTKSKIQLCTIFHTCTASLAALISIGYIACVDRTLILWACLNQLATTLSFAPPPYLVFHLNLQKALALASIAGRVFTLAFTLLLVNDIENAHLYFIIQVLAYTIPAATLYLKLLSSEATQDHLVTRDLAPHLFEMFRTSFPQLLRGSAFVPVSLAIPAALQQAHGASSIAIYAISDKIRTVAWQVFNPLIYSFAARYFSARTSSEALAKKIELQTRNVVLGLAAALASFLYLLTPEFVAVLNVSKHPEAVSTMHIASLLFISGACLAFINARYLPDLANAKPLTYAFWLVSIALSGAVFLYTDNLSVPIAVTTLFIWEATSAALTVFLNRYRLKYQ